MLIVQCWSVATSETENPTAFDHVTWPVNTERLSIRPARCDDADARWAYWKLEAVARWLSLWCRDREAWRERHCEPARLRSTLVVERDGVIIGDLMLKVEDAWAQVEVLEEARGVHAELGWAFDPAHVGKGYAIEAVRALLDICFVDLGLRRVTANCFAENERSWRLMERLGMRRELHTIAESLHRDRGWRDAFGYALLADEWSGCNADGTRS